MVRLTKSPLPPNVTITSEKDYRTDPVFSLLVNDCHSKCYICEDKPTTINVEHIIPHRNDKALKFNWDNLFLSCGHCNNTKLAKFEDILDPTKCNPEEHIALSVNITDQLIDCVEIEALIEDEITIQTVKLLDCIYNEGSTCIKKIECANLRNESLMPTIRLFYQYLQGHQNEPDLGYGDKIREELKRSSKFAAFKRKIIRDDPELSAEFASSLD